MGVNKRNAHRTSFIDGTGGAGSIQKTTGTGYHWKGTSYATYQTSTHWINTKGSNT